MATADEPGDPAERSWSDDRSTGGSLPAALSEWPRIWIVAFLAVLVPSAMTGLWMGLEGRYDLSYFHRDAQHMLGGLDQTDSRELEWYLPGFRTLLMPIGYLRLGALAMLWNAVNLAAVGAVLLGLQRCARSRQQADPVDKADCGQALRHGYAAIGLAFLLAAPVTYQLFQVNQISFWPLALLVWSQVAALEHRQTRAGLLLGAAVFVKIIPALLIGWCLWRRRLGMAIYAAVTPVVLSLGIDAAVNGVRASWRHHEQWYRVSIIGSTGTAFLENSGESRHRNQGLPVVLGRLLQPLPAGGSQPLPWIERRSIRQVNVASLDSATVKWIYYAICIGSLGALAGFTWRLGRRADPLVEHGLFGVWCVAMLWYAPLMRQYYLVWALPALWVLLDQAGRHGRRGDKGIACAIGIVAWIIGLAGWALPEARAAGVNQWAHLVIMVVLIVEMSRSRPSVQNTAG